MIRGGAGVTKGHGADLRRWESSRLCRGLSSGAIQTTVLEAFLAPQLRPSEYFIA